MRLYALTELALRSSETECHPDCDILGEKYVCLFLLIVALSMNFCKAGARGHTQAFAFWPRKLLGQWPVCSYGADILF